MKNETTFADVAGYLNNSANYPTARERAVQRRESDRLAARRAAWEQERVAHGLSVDPFEGF